MPPNMLCHLDPVAASDTCSDASRAGRLTVKGTVQQETTVQKDRSAGKQSRRGRPIRHEQDPDQHQKHYDAPRGKEYVEAASRVGSKVIEREPNEGQAKPGANHRA